MKKFIAALTLMCIPACSGQYGAATARTVPPPANPPAKGSEQNQQPGTPTLQQFGESQGIGIAPDH